MALRPATSLAVAALMAAVIGSAAPRVQSDGEPDWLARWSADRRAAAVAGTPVLDVLPAAGADFGVAGLVRTSATGRRLAAWAKEIEQLHAGKYVPAIGRFSPAPRPPGPRSAGARGG